MNKNFSSWLIVIIAAVAGVLLIAWHKEADLFSWLIRSLGFMIAIPGAYVLFSSLSVISRKTKSDTDTAVVTSGEAITFRKRSVAWSLIIVSAASMILGMWMLIAPSFFIGLVSYLFAVVLILCGILQLIDIIYFSRPQAIPAYFYIAPSLLVVAGVVILSTSVRTIDNVVTLLTGIMLLVYSVNWIVEQIVTRRYYSKIKNAGGDNRQ